MSHTSPCFTLATSSAFIPTSVPWSRHHCCRRQFLTPSRLQPQPQWRTPRTNITCKLQRPQPSSEKSEEEEPLEGILPPPVLPTLNTLTGNVDPLDLPRNETTSIQSDTADGPNQSDGEQQNVAQMGVGIPFIDNALAFLAEVAEEFKLIEFPTFGRVVRLTILVLVTVVLATTALYVVDGFFYRASRFLFEKDF